MNTVLEAFDHMMKEWKGRLPKDLHEAKQSRIGARQYALSEARAIKMLVKYGGGRYAITQTATYCEANA